MMHFHVLRDLNLQLLQSRALNKQTCSWRSLNEMLTFGGDVQPALYSMVALGYRQNIHVRPP